VIGREVWRLSASEVYGRHGITGVSLSPDGSTLAYTWVRERRAEEDHEGKRIKETAAGDVFMLPTATTLTDVGAYPRQLTNSGDVSQPVVWAPNGEQLLVERQGQLQLVRAAGTQAATPSKPVVLHKGGLFRPSVAPGATHLGGPRFSPDGRWLLAAVREASETTLVLLGTDGRSRRSLLAVEGYLVSWDWSPDSRRVVVVTQSDDAHVGDVRLVDIDSASGAGGEARVLWQETSYAYSKPFAAFVPGSGSSSGRIIFRSNQSGWSKLYSASGDGRDVQPLTTGAWDDDAIRFSPDGQQIVFSTRAAQEGTGDDLWAMPSAGGTPERLTRQCGIHHPIGWSPDGRIFYWYASPTDPGDVRSVKVSREPGAHRVDGAQQVPEVTEARRLTWSAPAELTRKLRAPEEVTFRSPDGTPISALVYLPAYHDEHQAEDRDGARYPPVVWIRGGPTAFSRYTFSAFPQWLANEGFVVITANYRGSTGHGVEFMDAVAGEGVGKYDLQDVLAAAAHVKTLPWADLSRGVGIGGHSWGGYLTLMAVTQAPDVFSCAAAGAAIADWTVQQAQTEVRWYDRWLVGGWLYERDAHARDRSPITHADRLKTPLLVLHGERDTDVPFAQIGPFVERAKKSGAPVEYVTFPNEGHGNRLLKNQQDYLDRMRTWFCRHLQPWNFRDNPAGGQLP